MQTAVSKLRCQNRMAPSSGSPYSMIVSTKNVLESGVTYQRDPWVADSAARAATAGCSSAQAAARKPPRTAAGIASANPSSSLDRCQAIGGGSARTVTVADPTSSGATTLG